LLPGVASESVIRASRDLNDVQAARDDELLALRNFGMLSIAEVRAVGR
jgi:hypothetical protein